MLATPDPGLNRECQYCLRPITEEDVEKGNGSIKMGNMPGFYHRKCRVKVDMFLLDTARVTEVWPR
jgi:hypothetical protein